MTEQSLPEFHDGNSAPATSTHYVECGWPVAVSRNQVLLILGDSVTALALPGQLVDAVTPVLAARDRLPAVLNHPGAPDHRVLLVGEPFGVALPWPAEVGTIGGAVPLPPTVTALGHARWLQPPHGPDLAVCREIDVFGAVRSTLLAGVRANGSEL